MSETPAEKLARLEAEDAARQAAAARKKKEEEQQQQLSMMGRLWDAVTDNFWLIALAFVAFVMIGPEKMKELWNKGSELVGGLMDEGIKMLPQEWQNNLNAMLGRDVSRALEGMDITEIRKTMLDRKIPADIVNVLANDKPTFQSFLNVARDANGGKVGSDDFTNDKTVFALLTKKPEMARELAAVALKADGASANSDAAKQIKASLLAIVKDNRLDVLLNPPHLDNTKALLAVVPNVDKQHLDTLLNDKGNVPAIRTFLTTMLTPAANGAQPNAAAAALAVASQVTSESRKALIDIEMKVKPSDDEETRKLKTNNGGKALATLREKLGDEKLMQFVALTSGKDDLAKLKFALENRAAFEAFHAAAVVKDLGPETQKALTGLISQPPAATAPLLAIINNGVDPRHLQTIIFNEKGERLPTPALVDTLVNNPAARLTLEKAGVDHVVHYAQLTKSGLPVEANAQNINAILKAADTIGNNPKMADATKRAETTEVLSALADTVINKNSRALNTISKDQLADFFADRTNSDALKNLLAQSTLPQMDTSQGQTAKALLAHWDTVRVLASDKENGAATILSFLSQAEKPVADSCKPTSPLMKKWDDLLLEGGLAWKGTDLLKLEKNVIGRNVDEIKALMQELGVAQCVDVKNAAAVASGRSVTGKVR